MVLRTRIIKSDTCPRCVAYLPRLDKAGFKYIIYDADDPSNEKQCDEWKIDELPVVQIIDESNNVKWQFPHGTYSPAAIQHKIEEILKKEKTK